jgi:sigma-B regulation protein RsbU (phosphoserine phosphatase)
MPDHATDRIFSQNPIASTPRKLTCGETWAKNTFAASLVELPGLTAWVHSVPFASGLAGGDVHYVSVCPSCIITRIALADVSGHGQEVAVFGDELQKLMQQYLLTLEPVKLLPDLNQVVREKLADGHYATMVVAGWHGRRGLLVMANAGHPLPLWYRAARDEWSWLEPPLAGGREQPSNVPLGLLPEALYDRLVIKPESGDLIVLYSDGVSEANDPGGNELGQDGLMKMARALEPSSADTFGTQLESALQSFRGAGELLDDETIIVTRINDK